MGCYAIVDLFRDGPLYIFVRSPSLAVKLGNRCLRLSSVSCTLVIVLYSVPSPVSAIKAHPRGGPGGTGPSPWDLPSTRFAGFIPLNYVICISATFVRNIFAMWKDGASLLHGSGLTFGRNFAPYWPLYKTISARALPLRKSWVRPSDCPVPRTQS